MFAASRVPHVHVSFWEWLQKTGMGIESKIPNDKRVLIMVPFYYFVFFGSLEEREEKDLIHPNMFQARGLNDPFPANRHVETYIICNAPESTVAVFSLCVWN